MELLGREMIDGHDTYRAVLRIEGGVGPAMVHDRFESWVDAAAWNDRREVFSRRFVQDQRELGKRRQRTYELSPERKQYRRVDTDETLPLNTDQPLDDVSVLLFARSLPLKVGDTYTISRYFKADANPIVLRVVRRETVTVPAGTFETVVVRPTIKTSGLFGEGGEAELYFSDEPPHPRANEQQSADHRIALASPAPVRSTCDWERHGPDQAAPVKGCARLCGVAGSHVSADSHRGEAGPCEQRAGIRNGGFKGITTDERNARATKRLWVRHQ